MKLNFQFGAFSRDNRITPGDMKDGAAIINELLTQHLYRKWGRYNECQAFPTEKDVPQGFAHVVLQDGLDEQGAAGYHTTDHGQPLIFVDTQGGNFAEALFTWGHECCEANVDPYGNKFSLPRPHPLHRDKLVRYLIEVCDPNEGKQFGFTLGGVLMPDFILETYYDADKTEGVDYSYQGHVKAPRTLLPGGYVSFVDEHNVWWQLTWFDNAGPKLQGPFHWTVRKGETIRTQADRSARDLKKLAQAA